MRMLNCKHGTILHDAKCLTCEQEEEHQNKGQWVVHTKHRFASYCKVRFAPAGSKFVTLEEAKEYVSKGYKILTRDSVRLRKELEQEALDG